MDDQKDVNILYVDDEEFNLFLFKANFRGKYNIFTAKSGVEALEFLDKNYQDIFLVITDMRMPSMDGVEFVRRSRAKYQGLRYFILSGFDHNENILQAVKENMIDRYFTKPFEMSEIEEAIDLALKER